MGLETEVSNDYAVGSLISQNDIIIREGESPYQTGSGRRFNIESSGEVSHFTELHHYYSQSQITVDGSELKLAASVLNWWILLNREINSLLSSVYQGIKFGLSFTPLGLMRVLESV